MPPRHAYWTIIIDDQPTAFRARDAEEILAIFNRLRDKHPSAVMKWFERGRLWDSREAARREAEAAAGPRDDREHRDRNWRPGGEHRDARQRYKDAKKQKWQRFKQQLRSRRPSPEPGSGEPDSRQDRGDFTPPHGDPMRPKVARPEWRRDDRRQWQPEGERRPARKPFGRKPFGAKPYGGKPYGGKPSGEKPYGGKPYGGKPPGGKPYGGKPYGGKPPGAKPFGAKPYGGKPYGEKPYGGQPHGGKPHGGKPFGGKPFGGKPAGARRFGAKPFRNRPQRPRKPRGGDEE